jgi:hypothetical protein
MQENNDYVFTVWLVADPLEAALFVGALAAVANGHPPYLDDQLTLLAEKCLARWPARARC